MKTITLTEKELIDVFYAGVESGTEHTAAMLTPKKGLTLDELGPVRSQIIDFMTLIQDLGSDKYAEIMVKSIRTNQPATADIIAILVVEKLTGKEPREQEDDAAAPVETCPMMCEHGAQCSLPLGTHTEHKYVSTATKKVECRWTVPTATA